MKNEKKESKAHEKAEKKNKLGVVNSLVNNINAKKKSGTSKTKKKSTVSKEAYDKMKKY
jgi:hypothetical protein